MAHQLEQMAYVGETPWHGLGNQLSPHQPIEVWAQQAGMDWRIESSDVSYMAKNERGQEIAQPTSVVQNNHNVFVGSTEDFLDMMEERKKKRKLEAEAIDADFTQVGSVLPEEPVSI